MIKVNNLQHNYMVKEIDTSDHGLKRLLNKKKKVINAINNISFTIHKGEIVGLVGLNGAGKTTLLKCLAGLIEPTVGEIQVDNYIPFSKENKFLKQISFFMGQKNQLIWDLPAIETFNINKAIYDINQKDFNEKIKYIGKILNVAHLYGIPVRQLSLGERVKMEFILALIHNPQFLILDEPTIGMDLESQIAIRKFLKDYVKHNNITCILTSHNMQDIMAVAERVILLNKGKIVSDSSVTELKYQTDESAYIYISFMIEDKFSEPEYLKGHKSVIKEDCRVVYKISKVESNNVIKKIMEDNCNGRRFYIEPEPIEEIIVKLLGTNKYME